MFVLSNGQKNIEDETYFEKTNATAGYDQYQKLAVALTKGQTHLDGLKSGGVSGEKRELDALKKIKDPYDCSFKSLFN